MGHRLDTLASALFVSQDRRETGKGHTLLLPSCRVKPKGRGEGLSCASL